MFTNSEDKHYLSLNYFLRIFVLLKNLPLFWLVFKGYTIFVYTIC